MHRDGGNMNKIGTRIRARRKELNITQLQIQAQTSISSGNLSSIENGKYLPSAITLLELSKILECSVEWILTGKSQINENAEILDIKESELIRLFRELTTDDQDEIIDILNIKYKRILRTKEQPEPPSDIGDIS